MERSRTPDKLGLLDVKARSFHLTYYELKGLVDEFKVEK